MSWVLIMDNGESYSDNSHSVVATCATREDADALMAILRQWLEDRPREPEPYRGVDFSWYYDANDTRHRFPLGSGKIPEEATGDRATVAAVEVPGWAEVRP